MHRFKSTPRESIEGIDSKTAYEFNRNGGAKPMCLDRAAAFLLSSVARSADASVPALKPTERAPG
ncbi:hypothetical protein J2785_003974 [Burkholderia ambifaria]|nr:hypothetical protein [Burkholderia ambifaria]MDR6500804.1 hypothetical protein [Burkholderia ambifaria]